MTLLVAALAALLVVAASSVDGAPQNAAANLGNGNISGYLGDRNLVMAQINCLKGTGQCNRLGVQLKQAIPEVLNNRCGRCSQAQAKNARKLIDYVRRNYPADYDAIMARYLGSG